MPGASQAVSPVQQPPRYQSWRCGLGSASGLLPGLGTGIWSWRQQRSGLNGKTSRPPCGIEGNHHEGDRFRTLRRPGQSTGRDQDCDQKSHRAIVPILQRYAVTSAAFSVPCLKPSSNFGVGDAAVGQSNAIANGFDLLSPIAFAHVFQLDCWPRGYCFCLCIFVAQESEFHGVNRDG